jgi:hypothetical protein
VDTKSRDFVVSRSEERGNNGPTRRQPTIHPKQNLPMFDSNSH